MRLEEGMAWDITIERKGDDEVDLSVSLRKGEASIPLMKKTFPTEEKAWVKLLRRGNAQLLKLGEMHDEEVGNG